MNIKCVEQFCDCIGRRGIGIRKRTLIIFIGSFTVSFLLFSVLLLPLFGGKTGLDIVSDMMGGVEKQTTTLGDEPPPDIPAFDYWYAPPDSFGIDSIRFVNWTFFDTCFSYETFYNNISSDYELEIEFDEVNQNIRKYKYKLKTEDEGYYGLNIVFNPNINDYTFYESNYSFVVHYDGGDIVYNFTDIVLTLDGDIDYYINDGVFHLELGKYLDADVEFEIDPTFGYTGYIGIWNLNADYIYGTKATMGAETGQTATSLTLDIRGKWDGGEKIKLAIVKFDDKSLVGYTEELTTGGTGDFTFDIVDGGDLIANEDYYLCWWCDNDLTVGVDSPSGGDTDDDADVYDGIYPDTVGFNNENAYKVAIYCTYTEVGFVNAAPTITNFKPDMDAFNQSVGNVICNATITDDDGNQSTVDFYTSTDNITFTWVQTNATVLNESVQFDYTTTDYQTTYYWKVTANDTHDNTSTIYNFETTPYRTLFFNDTFPTENWIDSDNNMTFEAGWENFTYSASGGDMSTSWYDSFEGNAHETVVATVPATYWNDGGEEISWWYGDGYTTSASTGCGITGDRNPVDGTDIVFTETSSTPLGAPPALYSLESDSFTIGSGENASVNFYYHMYGAGSDFDYCYVQIDDGIGGWDTLWSLTSESHSGYASSDWWDEATGWSDDGANAPYTGSHKFRFLVEADSTYLGDFCLDSVWLNVTSTGGVTDAWIMSDEIFLPDTYTWNTFDAYVNQTLSCSFALIDPDDNDYNITSGLTGMDDDISSVTNDSIQIFGNFSDDSVNTASWNISWTTGVAPPTNTAPTSSDEAPTNQTDCVDYVASGITTAALVTDFDGDDMNVSWWSNSSGAWKQYGVGNSSVSNNTNISMLNANFTTGGTKYWWWMLIDDGEDGAANDSYSFTICDNDTVVVTLIDYMPTNIRTNNVGEAWFLYNITTNNTAINFWSIVWAYSVNHTVTDTQNTSYSLEDHLAEDKLRGINRNVNYTIESKFNDTMGDGSIGGFGEWNTHDGNKNITLVDSGSNWTLVNATEVIAEHLFSTISFVDSEELAIEDKTTQTIEISRTNFVKIEFNMTDTGWYDAGHYKNTSMFFHVYANHTNANKPLDIFYANSNYTTGSISTSPYAELVGDIHPTDSYHFTEYNSSYYEIDFNINETGFVGSVDATSKFYIILCSQTPSVKKWYLHYADDNISHSLAGNIHYHDFDNRTIMTISDDGASSWSANSSTPDTYFNYVSLDEEDKSEVKLYANDTSGNSAWSSVHVDLIDITNYPPDPANILVPNVDTNYTVGDTIPINYHWIGDPNLDTCWVNITLWDWDTITLQTWIINQSITDEEHANNNSNFTYNWDTTGITPSNYTISINITDNSLWNNHSSEIFYINQSRSWNINFSFNFSFSNTSRQYYNTGQWNFSFSNTSRIHYNIDQWNFSFSNTTRTHLNTGQWNFSFSNSSRTFYNTGQWNFSFSNSSRTFYNTGQWNFSFSNTSRTHYNIEQWNFSFSNSSRIHYNTGQWNFSFSNSSRIHYNIEQWNFSFSNTSKIHYNIEQWNFSFSNTSGANFTLVDSWNFSFSNTSKIHYNIEQWNFSFSNTTQPAVLFITNEHPMDTALIPYTYPTLYFTINSTNGLNMNYTIYWGTNLTLSETLNISNTNTNNTYYHAFSNASTNNTLYYWSVNLTDTDNNWLNETYSFTTRYERGATGGRMGLAPSIFAIALITYVLALFILFNKKKKNKKNNR